MIKEDFNAFIKDLDDDYEKDLKAYCDQSRKIRGDYVNKAVQLIDNLCDKYGGTTLGLLYDKEGTRWATVAFNLPALDVTKATLKFFNGPVGGVFFLEFSKNGLRDTVTFPQVLPIDTMIEFVVKKINDLKEEKKE